VRTVKTGVAWEKSEGWLTSGIRAYVDITVCAGMAKANDEMAHWQEYDYIVVNRDLDDSLAKLRAILIADRQARDRQVGLYDFVKRLQEGF
jgi:guanylate kinase